MDKLKEFFISLLLFIGFSAIGTVIGYNIGKTQAELNSEGKFSYWKEFNGSLKFEQIAEATSQIVWAKTADGTLYSWNTNCNLEANCNQWIQTIEIPVDIHQYNEPPIEKGSSCPSSNLKYFTNPPGKLAECVRAISYGMDIMPGKIVYYALSNDGKIWAWKFSYSMIDDFIYIILYTCPGFTLGVVAFIVLIIYRKRRKTNQNTAGSSTK